MPLKFTSTAGTWCKTAHLILLAGAAFGKSLKEQRYNLTISK